MSARRPAPAGARPRVFGFDFCGKVQGTAFALVFSLFFCVDRSCIIGLQLYKYMYSCTWCLWWLWWTGPVPVLPVPPVSGNGMPDTPGGKGY